MARKPVGKARPRKAETKPNLPHHNLPPHLAPLLLLGRDEDPEYGLDLQEKVPDEFKGELIEQLLAIAADETFYTYSEDEDPNPDPRCFAQVNAVRALCYVAEGNDSIVEPVLALYTSRDYLILEELPVLFASIGEGAFPRLAATVADEDADPCLRDGAAESMAQITELYPDLYEKAVEVIEAALQKSPDTELCAYFASVLLEMGSEQSVPIIQQAFLEDKIDQEILSHDEFNSVLAQIATLPDVDGEEDIDVTIGDVPGDPEEEAVVQAPFVAEEKVGRNDACPCGSGKKYKKCCGVGK